MSRPRAWAPARDRDPAEWVWENIILFARVMCWCVCVLVSVFFVGGIGLKVDRLHCVLRKLCALAVFGALVRLRISYYHDVLIYIIGICIYVYGINVCTMFVYPIIEWSRGRRRGLGRASTTTTPPSLPSVWARTRALVWWCIDFPFLLIKWMRTRVFVRLDEVRTLRIHIMHVAIHYTHNLVQRACVAHARAKRNQ